MPNTLVPLDVPLSDGPGVATDTSQTGSPKTFIFSGPVTGRYIVEGSPPYQRSSHWPFVTSHRHRRSRRPGAPRCERVDGLRDNLTLLPWPSGNGASGARGSSKSRR